MNSVTEATSGLTALEELRRHQPGTFNLILTVRRLLTTHERVHCVGTEIAGSVPLAGLEAFDIDQQTSGV